MDMSLAIFFLVEPLEMRRLQRSSRSLHLDLRAGNRFRFHHSVFQGLRLKVLDAESRARIPNYILDRWEKMAKRCTAAPRRRLV